MWEIEKKAVLRDSAYGIQSNVLDFVKAAKDLGFIRGCKNVETDGDMLLFYDEKTFMIFCSFFDAISLDFTTGKLEGENEPYYIDFEFSDGYKTRR